MNITKTDKGWRVDIRPNGRGGKRIRKTLQTKAEALRFAAWAKTQYTQRPEWEPPQKDGRSFHAIIKRWYELRGKELTSGKSRKLALEAMCREMGNPRAVDMTGALFSEYRARRLAEGVSPNTMNHHLAYLRAAFNELERAGDWPHPNPVGKVRQLKVGDSELSYLDAEQVRTLLDTLREFPAPDGLRVTQLCLATGARWSEAETLRAENLSRELVTYVDTKSGRNRSVPITPALFAELNPKKKKSGRLFKPCYNTFRTAIDKTGITLPDGQMTHVLRHTFASHFMMNGGNILVLQKILGHTTLTMTMRYAHLAPDHLKEAARLNPLATMDLQGSPDGVG